MTYTQHILKLINKFTLRTGLLYFIFLIAQFSLAAATYHVKTTGSDLNNGLSWTNAYATVQQALSVATSGDEIWVAEGTYYPTAGTDRTVSFIMQDGVEMYGGFPATGTPSMGVRDWTAHVTTLSGDIGALGDNVDNSYHVIYNNTNGLSASAILDGFTISGGNADGSGEDTRGGGMFNESSSPVMINITFSNNSARKLGGGMFNESSSPTVTNSIFSNNAATDDGGGMYSRGGSSPIVDNTVFSGNSATNGGGMFNKNSSPTVTNSTFSNNTAGAYGGGMHNRNASPTVTNSTFSSNTADHGGGIYNDISAPTVTSSTFSSHMADFGGGIFNQSSSPTILNSIFSDNNAYGGGICNNDSSSPVITNSTFFNNISTSGAGGGMYNISSSSPVATNCIFWDDDSSTEIYNISSSSATVTYSIVRGGYTGVGNKNEDPAFSNPSSGDLHISGCSSAVDAGTDTGAPVIDFDGNPRYDAIPGGAVTDMGAFEFQGGGGGCIYHVKTTGSDTNHGLNWDNAFATVQQALAVVNSGDEIWVAEGTYYPTSGTDRTISFTMKDGVAIYGGFPDAGTPDMTDRDWETYTTTLSGNIGDLGLNTDNSYHVIRNSVIGASAILDGFTVSGGKADGSSTDERGGGMFNNFTASPTVNNVMFSENAAIDGGGMYNSAPSSTTVTNVTFSNNTATTNGGGMYNSSSPATVTNVTFSDNTANLGGGMYNSSSSTTVSNVTFSDNTANSAGGGMYNSSSSPIVTSASFSDNTATNGGGMYNTSSSPTVTSSTFLSNSATNRGGGMYNFGSSPLMVDNTEFSENSANDGGGMYNSSCSPTVTNSTFSDNTANSGGGGMYNASSSPTVTGTTFSNNTAADGGGMYNLSSSSPTVNNTMFLGNSATDGGGMYNTASSSPIVSNVTFSSNTANSKGGGMYNTSSSPAVSNVTFSSNTGADGGGMYNHASSPTVTNSTFANNSAGNGGGMYNTISSTLPTITRTIFSNNNATNGGGMFNTQSSSPTLDNTVFFENSANTGGGMFNFQSSSPTVTSSTFANNTASFAPGIENQLASPTVTNCILWSDNDNSNQIRSTFPAAVVTYSIVRGGHAGVGNKNTNPLFIDSSSGDLHILHCSPALDAGTDAGVSATDFDGNSRYDAIPGGTVTDMGAFEFQAGDSAEGCPVLYHVKTTGSDTNDGLTWGTAFATVQQALSLATSIDEIWVAEGTYYPTSGSNRSIYFIMKDGLEIYGGFPASGTPEMADRDWETYTTILSGNIGNPAIDTDNSFHVIFNNNNGLDASAILDGFTISGGFANGGISAKRLGAGMYNVSSSPTINNAVFSNNTAAFSGGGMYNSNSSPTVTNATFFNNISTSGAGGGMSNSGSSPTITNVTFSLNFAPQGGGMSCVGSSPTIDNCEFLENTADYGGGMYNNSSSSPTIDNCEFLENTATADGGGMHNSTFSNPTITNVTFSLNSAVARGGGMFDQTANPTIANATFSLNSADSGGGMYNYSYSSPTITNVSFSLNSANDEGGGMYNTTSSSPTITNCILWDDDGSSEIYDANSSSPNISYSIVRGGYSGVGNKDEDPLFIDPSSSDLHIPRCSPAIDAGTDTGAPSTDFDGNNRYDAIAGGVVTDMGAFEFQAGGSEENCPPVVYYVKTTGNDTNNGKTWGTAFATVQQALSFAFPGDKIWVAEGTYYPTSGTNRSISFIMQDGVEIYGGFSATGTPEMADRDWETYITTLSGNIGNPGLDTDNSYHVIFNGNNSLDASAVLDGFTVSGGFANGGTTVEKRGGGMYNYYSSPTITNVIFSNNAADFSGGGMYTRNCSSTVTKATFSNNTAVFDGGGMYTELSSSLTVTNTSFSLNSADRGGGMYNSSSSPALSNVTFFDNTADYGGGMYNASSSPMIINASFSSNSANDFGGGLFNTSISSPTITNCILWDDDGTSEIYDVTGSTSSVNYSIVRGGFAGVGNRNESPGFIDPSSGDLHIFGDSPAVDAGTDTGAPVTDFDGNARYDAIAGGAVTDIGAFEFQAGGIVPVELLHFSAKQENETVQLNWQTSFETNNEGFEIEHSTNARDWDYLDFVQGQGNTIEVHEYNFIHRYPVVGINYYRLRQVDFDGAFEYSDIRSLNFEMANSPIKLYPNPASILSNIQLPLNFEQASIRVTDVNGRIVYETEIETGNSLQVIDVRTLLSGLYLIQVQVDKQIYARRLIVTHH